MRELPRRTPLRTPVRRLLHLARAVRGASRHGQLVARTNGHATIRQSAQLARLNWHYDFSPEDYYRYRMYRLADREAAPFVPLETNIALRTQLYGKLGLDQRLLADKRLFLKACTAAGLPVAETIADFAKGEVHW